jgi:hypothetical protein
VTGRLWTRHRFLLIGIVAMSWHRDGIGRSGQRKGRQPRDRAGAAFLRNRRIGIGYVFAANIDALTAVLGNGAAALTPRRDLSLSRFGCSFGPRAEGREALPRFGLDGFLLCKPPQKLLEPLRRPVLDAIGAADGLCDQVFGVLLLSHDTILD